MIQTLYSNEFSDLYSKLFKTSINFAAQAIVNVCCLCYACFFLSLLIGLLFDETTSVGVSLLNFRGQDKVSWRFTELAILTSMSVPSRSAHNISDNWHRRFVLFAPLQPFCQVHLDEHQNVELIHLSLDLYQV